ncbi:hypothetical protein DJ031_00305 [bacterium endosymbiont of Escarpia laminata]|nr:MAG: hypothetical protein DJ031_00305 [bacterium endosymbiont of Escarpia laminata]
MENRVASTERLLGEIHAMVQALRPPPAALSAPAALGSAAQMVAADVAAPPVVDWGHPVPLQPVGAEPGPAFQPHPVGPDVPWVNAEAVCPGNGVVGSLSEDTQNLISSCTSTSLPLDSQIPDALREKIWAGEFIDLSLLLTPTLTQQQDYALSIHRGVSTPTFCVSPTKPKSTALSFEQWGQAFQLYMSVYLLQPTNLHAAVKMLKYIEVIRGLAEDGGNWRAYDEAFRALRYRWGWSWDVISWELWLKASQAGRRSATGSPFQGKGRARPQSTSPCFAYNRGELCNRDTCRYAHKCNFCGGSHPFVRCFKAQGKRPRPSGPPSSSPPGGPSTSWFRK